MDPDVKAIAEMTQSGGFTFGSIMVSMLVSGIGFVLFKYGRKQGRSLQVTFGVILMIFPYFIYDIKSMLLIAGGLCAVLYLLLKKGF